jgi:hypothetical protein
LNRLAEGRLTLNLLVFQQPAKQVHQEGIMLGGLLFVVCVILQFHYHDPIPWYIWVLALIAQCVAFGEPAMRSAAAKKN